MRKPGFMGAIVYAFRWTYGTILLPLFEPLLTNRDFFWVFLTRFFIQLGQYTVQVRLGPSIPPHLTPTPTPTLTAVSFSLTQPTQPNPTRSSLY